MCVSPTLHMHTHALMYFYYFERDFIGDHYYSFVFDIENYCLQCAQDQKEGKRGSGSHVISGCFWIYTNSGYSEYTCFQKVSISQLLMQWIDSDLRDVDFIYDKLDED